MEARTESVSELPVLAQTGTTTVKSIFSFSFFRRKYRKAAPELITIEAFDPHLGLPQLQYFVGDSPIIRVPANILVMQGAHFYSSHQHPFNIALTSGSNALQQFYHRFSPKNLVEMYRLHPQGLKGEDLPPWELPWLLRKRKHPSGEGGLGPEHGVSFFGPCTPEKVRLELDRLTNTISSIRANGYRPDRHGHIEGYFLKRADEYRFFILGGKHRAASLYHLGYSEIPVRMRVNCPRVIDLAEAEQWPLVRSGEVSLELAKAIFHQYFDLEG